MRNTRIDQCFSEAQLCVPAFFAGLLPEGARLSAIQQLAKTSASDELTLLLAVGYDCVGDVRVVTAGSDPDALATPTAIDPATASFEQLLAQSTDVTNRFADSAVPGVQPKLSDSMISFPVTFGSSRFILKLGRDRYPNLIENEAFFMRAAADCGIEVAQTQVIHDRNGAPGLLVTRFDRSVCADGVITRIAQEDASQLADKWPADKYRMSSADAMRAITSAVAAELPAVLNFVRLTAFSYLIGNGDLHAKNVSAYGPLPESKIVRDTPAYDLISTIPYGDRYLALSFDGKNSNLNISNFIRFASMFGLSQKAVVGQLIHICERHMPWLDRLHEIGLEDPATDKLRSVLVSKLQHFQ